MGALAGLQTFGSKAFPRKSPFTPGTGGVPGPYPAPAGWRWDYSTFNGEIETFQGSPIVTLVRTS